VKGIKTFIAAASLAIAGTAYGGAPASATQVSSLQEAVGAYRSGNVHLALRHLYCRVASGAATPGDYIYIGHCLFCSGDVQGAVAAYTNALQQDPRALDAYTGLAKSYVALGNLRYASAVKARALQYGCPVDVSTTPAPPLRRIGS
jgi:tetratricopeptide (TPR) repeat protein